VRQVGPSVAGLTARCWRTITGVGTNNLIVAAALLLALSLGCAEDSSQEGPRQTTTTPTDDELRRVPLPEVGGLDPEIQLEIRQSHRGLETSMDAGTSVHEEHGRLGMQLDAFGLRDAAEIAYRNARQLAPDDFRWAYYLALLYEAQSRPEEAIDAFLVALALRPDYVAGLARLGDVYLLQGRSNEARQRFDRGLELDATCAQCLVGLGRLSLQDQEYERAATQLEQALTIAPWAATIRYPLAQAYRALGRDGEAQGQLDERADATRNIGLGRVIDRPGVYDPLLEQLRAVAVAGKVAYEARGVMAAREGRWNEALEQFDKMIEADPEDPVSRNLLAITLLNMGNREEAREQYQETLRLDPAHAGANIQLGIFLAEDGQERDAISRFRQAVESDPGSNVAHLNLAAALLRDGQPSEAAAAYNALIALDPSNGPARLGRAFALIRAGRHPEAKAALEDDTRAQPNEIAFPHTLARLLAASPDDSVRNGRRAFEILAEITAVVQSPQVMETTAMAAAEVGLFEDAARYQGMAIEMANQAGLAALAAQLNVGLSRYRQRQPSRQPFADHDPVFAPAPFSPQALVEARAQ